MQTIYLKLTVASPVSIGCDEVYEPTGFVVDEEAGQLIHFDTHEFLRMLDGDALRRFSAICTKGSVTSLLELMRFMREHREHARGDRCELVPEFMEHYRQVLGLQSNPQVIQQNLNKFQIGRTAFNPHTNLPVIPGSSIKGAIRTAVLNLRNNGRTSPSFRGRQAGRELQEHLLKYRTRELAGDPFRLLKVSDFVPAGEFRRRIIYAANLKKRPSERDCQGPPQILEVIEPGAVFFGTISIQQPAGPLAGITTPLTWREIEQAVHGFYGSENKRENRELAGIGANQLSLDSSGLPLRIGRHSGAECVTVAGHRSIKVSPPGTKPVRFKDHATTLWLAAESRRPATGARLRPFGWTMLEAVAENDRQGLYKTAQTLEEEWLREIRTRAEQRRTEALELARRAAQEEAERKQQEEIARQRAEQEAREKEKWQQMGEIEQYAAIILGKDIARSQAPEKEAQRDIWPKLDSLEGEEQKIVAQAFHDLWSGQEKLWRKKSCSSGQWKKVKRIVSLLDVPHPDIRQTDPETEQLIARIQELRDWGAFASSGIEMESLSLAAAEELEKRLGEWGCKNKKAKKNKKQAWRNLRNHLRKLRKAQ